MGGGLGGAWWCAVVRTGQGLDLVLADPETSTGHPETQSSVSHKQSVLSPSPIVEPFSPPRGEASGTIDTETLEGWMGREVGGGGELEEGESDGVSISHNEVATKKNQQEKKGQKPERGGRLKTSPERG